jgi:hypothetical protein
MSFLGAQSSPAWANIRAVDVVRLVGTGMCSEAAIFSFAADFPGRRFTEDQGSCEMMGFPIVRATFDVFPDLPKLGWASWQ